LAPNKFQFSAAAGVFLSLFLNQSCAAADEQMLTVWCDGGLFSKAEVNLSSKGFRFKSQVGTSIWQTKAPDKAILMNTESKVYMPVPLDEYVHEMREDYAEIPVDKLKAPKDVTLPSGFKGKQYDANGIPPVSRHRRQRGSGHQLDVSFGQRSQRIYDSLPHKRKGPEPPALKPGEVMKVADFVCMETTLPVQVQQVWCRFMGVKYSPKRGMPVGSRQIVLRNWMEKQAFGGPHAQYRDIVKPRQIKIQPLDPKLFEIPKGFMKAKDRASLYLSVDGDLKKEDIEDLFAQPLK